MRDPDRLDKIYKIIKDDHKRCFPDWRIGQVIMNFIAAYGDPFYMEDDIFLQKWKEYIKNFKSN